MYFVIHVNKLKECKVYGMGLSKTYCLCTTHMDRCINLFEFLSIQISRLVYRTHQMVRYQVDVLKGLKSLVTRWNYNLSLSDYVTLYWSGHTSNLCSDHMSCVQPWQRRHNAFYSLMSWSYKTIFPKPNNVLGIWKWNCACTENFEYGPVKPSSRVDNLGFSIFSLCICWLGIKPSQTRLWSGPKPNCYCRRQQQK